jgi:hypothetical protein
MASVTSPVPVTHWGPTDIGPALLLGMAIALVPLVVAIWPRFVAFRAEHRRGAETLPAGVTPFIAAELSGLNVIGQLATGLMWLIARGPGAAAAASAAASEPATIGANAERYLRDSLCPRGSFDTGARDEALHLIDANGPTPHDLSPLMAGLRESARGDGMSIGLLRNSRLISRAILALAIAEVAISFVIEGSAFISPAPFFGGLFTAYIAQHVDPRSTAGARVSGDLRRLRSTLRRAALATGSIDVSAVQAFIPSVETATEAEVWAVAAGCRTTDSERISTRLRSLVHAEAGRPARIRYTEQVLIIGGRTADDLAARLGRTGGRRRGPDGAALPLW